jgi:hypothetical protein
MPVQELRYFSREGVSAISGSSNGLFRVNAIYGIILSIILNLNFHPEF